MNELAGLQIDLPLLRPAQNDAPLAGERSQSLLKDLVHLRSPGRGLALRYCQVRELHLHGHGVLVDLLKFLQLFGRKHMLLFGGRGVTLYKDDTADYSTDCASCSDISWSPVGCRLFDHTAARASPRVSGMEAAA